MGNSSLAYAWENHRYEEELREKREKLVSERKKAAKKNRAIFVGYVLMLILAAVFMIGKNVAEYETEIQIKNLQKELAAVESYTSQKLFELEEDIDLTYIEETATSRLGMQKPTKDQTIYVNIKRDDVCEITSGDVEGISNTVKNTASDLKRNVIGIFSLK
ncbi:MAG: hypothetical protein Q4B31_00340 [Clostridia bacterium]|nr:hypothetical protein [Clostridia bacterium]